MQLIKTRQTRHGYILVPLMIVLLGCAVSVQAASKDDLENNEFNCSQVGSPLKTVTRCEKCEKNPQTGASSCSVYYCDESGANCHPQAPLVTADPQEPDIDHPLVGLGDVNTDGVADIAVGDPAHGQIIVLSGADNRVITTLKSENPQSSMPFGQWFSGIEDVNGDAVADIVTKDSTVGRLSFFSGANGAKLATMESGELSDEATFRSPLPEMGRVAGDAVVGDLNKDGVADLAIVDASHGQVLIFSGFDGSLVSILAVPGLLDPVVATRQVEPIDVGSRRVPTRALTFANSCVERTKYVQAGSWRTLETLWNVAAQGRFYVPAGAQIKVRRGVGWFAWDTQKQTLDGVNSKILSVGSSVIPSRMQMKVSQSTNVTYGYCPVGP